MRQPVMGIPIKLRGETIGIIHLQDERAAERTWAAEEIQTVQSIADQVAQALENARLFEQTVRRADRERKVLEITSKIRSTTDPQAMMQIAIEELQRCPARKPDTSDLKSGRWPCANGSVFQQPSYPRIKW